MVSAAAVSAAPTTWPLSLIPNASPLVPPNAPSVVVVPFWSTQPLTDPEPKNGRSRPAITPVLLIAWASTSPSLGNTPRSVILPFRQMKGRTGLSIPGPNDRPTTTSLLFTAKAMLPLTLLDDLLLVRLPRSMLTPFRNSDASRASLL